MWDLSSNVHKQRSVRDNNMKCFHYELVLEVRYKKEKCSLFPLPTTSFKIKI